jgi:hypothetical protein
VALVFNKKFALVLAVLALFGVIFGCVSSQPQVLDSQNLFNVSISVIDDTNAVIFSESRDFNAGTNAFDAMKSLIGENMNYQKYDFGVMVSSIYGVDAPSTHYWALYVDNNYASKGIADYIIDNPVKFEWRLEKIVAYPGN